MGRSIVERRNYVPRLYWGMEETAMRLGISTSTLTDLRTRSDLYKPDGVRPGTGQTKLPLWSEEKLKFIAFAWSLTPQGERRYTDEEANQLWNEIQKSTDREYLEKAGMVCGVSYG